MQFTINFDYLCPFAFNANEGVLAGIDAGRDWDVGFLPFSLSQVHVADGDPDVFRDLERPGIRALHWGLAARDNDREHFAAVHRSLFAARHTKGLDIADDEIIRSELAATGVDVEAIAAVVDSGRPGDTLEAEHQAAVDRHSVFGVPTFIVGESATFVRLMSRGDVRDVDRVLDMLRWDSLNEFKRTKRHA